MTQILERPTSSATRERPALSVRPARRKMSRTVKLLAVDTAFFVAFVAVMNVPLTGLAVHEWIGVAIGVFTVVHLLQHGDWIATTTRRLLSKASFKNRLNHLMMILLFLSFVTAVASGLIISEVVLPIVGLVGSTSDFWLWLHVITSSAVVWLTAVHIALNWRWIVNTFNRHVFKDRTTAPTRSTPIRNKEMAA